MADETASHGNAIEAGPNAEEVEYWNTVAGPKWVALSDFIDAQIAPLGRRAMDAAGLESGARVLDVGCGCGQTSLELAQRTGESGRVVGLDISEPMLTDARRRADATGLSPERVEFVRGDAQLYPFAGDFDRIFSRFGVMFFADPPAAFANLRRALRVGGRLTFLCWQGLQRNPWMSIPVLAVAPHVELPAPPAAGAPGPFAFADDAYVHDILERAGFARIDCAPLEDKVSVGGEMKDDLESIANFLIQLGPAGAALREASEETRLAALGAVREALLPYLGANGVEMDAAAWIVSAVNED